MNTRLMKLAGIISEGEMTSFNGRNEIYAQELQASEIQRIKKIMSGIEELNLKVILFIKDGEWSDADNNSIFGLHPATLKGNSFYARIEGGKFEKVIPERSSSKLLLRIYTR